MKRNLLELAIFIIFVIGTFAVVNGGWGTKVAAACCNAGAADGIDLSPGVIMSLLAAAAVVIRRRLAYPRIYWELRHVNDTSF